MEDSCILYNIVDDKSNDLMLRKRTSMGREKKAATLNYFI
jgi:hypothetical protein